MTRSDDTDRFRRSQQHEVRSIPGSIDDKGFPQNPFPDQTNFGWIQWKGTDVCIDIHCYKPGCESGIGHLDSEYPYFIRCGGCGTVYALSPYVELIEITDPEVIAEVGDHIKEVEVN